MRNKLHLTDEEIMNKSWIALNLELQDYPFYDYKAKNVVKKEETGEVLSRIFKK